MNHKALKKQAATSNEVHGYKVLSLDDVKGALADMQKGEVIYIAYLDPNDEVKQLSGSYEGLFQRFLRMETTDGMTIILDAVSTQFLFITSLYKLDFRSNNNN